MRPDARSMSRHDARSEALRILGGGVGMLDAGGCLVGADGPFLELHGIASDGGCPATAPHGTRWPAALTALGSGLSRTDGEAVETAWAALLEGARESAAARDVVRLANGRSLVIGCSPWSGPETLLTVAEFPGDIGAEAGRGRLAHDVNNVLGGMLAHLYLALSDIEADHPARPWVEAVNGAAARMREHLLQARAPKNAGPDGPASGG